MNKQELVEEVQRLQDNVEHLMACKEFEGKLQREIIDVGMKYVLNVGDGKTYSVMDAWWAIQRALKETQDDK